MFFLRSVGGRCGKHAAAANARHMQSRIFHNAHARCEAGFFNLVPPQRNRLHAVPHAAFHSLRHAPVGSL